MFWKHSSHTISILRILSLKLYSRCSTASPAKLYSEKILTLPVLFVFECLHFVSLNTSQISERHVHIIQETIISFIHSITFLSLKNLVHKIIQFVSKIYKRDGQFQKFHMEIHNLLISHEPYTIL